MTELLVVIYEIDDDAKPMLQGESIPNFHHAFTAITGKVRIERKYTPARLGSGLKARWRY